MCQKMPPKSAKLWHYSLSWQNSVKFCKDFTQNRIFLLQHCWHIGTFLHLWAQRTFLPWYVCQWWGSWEPYRQLPLALRFPRVLSVSRFSKKRLKWLNLWKYRGTNTQEFPMCLFCQKTIISIENFVKHIVNHQQRRCRHFLCSDMHLF